MQKVVIIGCGAMGQQHAKSYNAVKDAKVYAVVDTDSEKGKALAGRLNCRWAENIEQLDPEQIDFVDICLPTHFHFSAIVQASKITKNIICEKPLAINPDQINEIFGLVREKGLRLMIAHVIRFWDCYVKARGMVRSGALGKINSIVCTRRQKRPAWSSGNWLSNVSLSGGLTFDLLIHDIDYIVWLMGRPGEVFANIVNSADGVPAHMKVQMLYDGCTVDVFGSWGMPEGFADGGLNSNMEIVGEKGMIFCDNNGSFVLTDSEGEHPLEFTQYDAYAEELRYFTDCCRKNISPVLADIDAIAESMEVIQMIRQSAEKNCVVKLDKTVENRGKDNFYENWRKQL